MSRTYVYQVDSHGVFVEKMKSNACVTRTLTPPPSAGLAADVRLSLSAEMGGIVPTKMHCVDKVFWQEDPCSLGL